jgi:hypothetical protein
VRVAIYTRISTDEGALARPTSRRTDRFASYQQWWAAVDSNHLPPR